MLIYMLEDDQVIRDLVLYALRQQTDLEAQGFERPSAFYAAVRSRVPEPEPRRRRYEEPEEEEDSIPDSSPPVDCTVLTDDGSGRASLPSLRVMVSTPVFRSSVNLVTCRFSKYCTAVE